VRAVEAGVVHASLPIARGLRAEAVGRLRLRALVGAARGGVALELELARLHAESDLERLPIVVATEVRSRGTDGARHRERVEAPVALAVPGVVVVAIGSARRLVREILREPRLRSDLDRRVALAVAR